MNKNPICPKCKAAEVIKSGKILEKQRYKCKKCLFQFTRLTPHGKPASDKAKAVELYIHGLSMRSIGKILNVSTTSVLRWIRKFAKETYEKPEPGDAILVELDEMWHFLNSKKNKLWIWKAYRRETGELIDWQCGSRDAQTFLKTWNHLKKWNVELFCPDEWHVYPQVIDEEKLFQGKSQTIYIEQNNNRQRHCFARFKRKSIVVSKSLEMVDLTMALFAKLDVNGNYKNILALLK